MLKAEPSFFHRFAPILGAGLKRGPQASKVLLASAATLLLSFGIACGDREQDAGLREATATPPATVSPTPTEPPEESIGRSPAVTPVPSPDTTGVGGTSSIAEFLSQHPWEKYGGDESLPGIYLLLDPDNFGAFLELAPDATFLLETGREDYRGQWEADGGRLVLRSAAFEPPVIVPTDLGAGGVRWIGRPVP